MTSKKDEIIAKVYYDTAGYGSVANTWADAKKYDSTITFDDVKNWKARNYRKKNQCKRFQFFCCKSRLVELEHSLVAWNGYSW